MRDTPYISVTFGRRVLQGHFVDDNSGGGFARFDIVPGEGSVDLVDLNDGDVMTSIPKVDHALQLAIVSGTGNHRYIAYAKSFPLRSLRDGLEVLVPGGVSDNLGLFKKASLKLTVHH